jgi:hypothetical protein
MSVTPPPDGTNKWDNILGMKHKLCCFTFI